MLRRLSGQHLLSPADTYTVVRDLCGLQAQFLSNALHAIRLRGGVLSEEELDRLVKTWTIRGTVHVIHIDDLPLFLHRDRKRELRPCDTLEADERIDGSRKAFFADLITGGIAAGTDTRDGLRALCADQGMTEREAESVFDPWGGAIRALCENGTIAYRVQEKKAFRLCPPFTPLDAEAAKLELCRRYFTSFGPATVRDAAYFFRAPQREIWDILERLPVRTCETGGRTYFHIPDREPASDMPSCLFLAGFDQLMLGYEKTENPFLPPQHMRSIFSLAGIVSPAVLLRGTVAGKWKRTGKKLTVTVFEPLSTRDRRTVERAAHATWPDLKEIVFA